LSDLPYLQSEMVVGLVGLDSTGVSTVAVGATATGLRVTIVDTSGNGNITALNQSVVANTSGYSTAIFTLTGTWSATIFIEGFDGTQWFTTQGVLEPVGILLTNLIDNQTVSINCGGMQKVRLRATAFTSGTVNISWNAGSGVNSVWAYNYNYSTLQALVRRPQDLNRTILCFNIDRIAGVTTEALSTFTINKGGTVTSGTTYTITNGKTLRITAVSATVLNTTTTTNTYGRIRFRSANPVLVSSPILLNMDIPAVSQPATIGIGNNIVISIPDGLEIAGGQQIGITQIMNSTNSVVSINVVGFEY
jgi:hypothetical protein